MNKNCEKFTKHEMKLIGKILIETEEKFTL